MQEAASEGVGWQPSDMILSRANSDTCEMEELQYLATVDGSGNGSLAVRAANCAYSHERTLVRPNGVGGSARCAIFRP
jgi:hypothetical protein